jgi:ferrochelatase
MSVAADDTSELALRLGGAAVWGGMSVRAIYALCADGTLLARLVDGPYAADIARALRDAFVMLARGSSSGGAVRAAAPLASLRFVAFLAKSGALALLLGLSYCPFGRLTMGRRLLAARKEAAAAHRSGRATLLRALLKAVVAPAPLAVVAAINAFVLPLVSRALAAREHSSAFARALLALVSLLRGSLTVATTVAALTFVQPTHFTPSDPWIPELRPHQARPHTASSRPVGVLVCNLGTVSSPHPRDVATFLSEFLMDRRVVEISPAVWSFVLNVVILPVRRFSSGKLYSRLFQNAAASGKSPLLHFGELFVRGLQQRLGDGFVVELGMRYGAPSIHHALARLKEHGCHRVVCLPMYPQYSGTTTASIYDAVMTSLLRYRYVPTLRVVEPFYGHPAYVQAVAQVTREFLSDKGPIDKFVISYHGIPQRYHTQGDPYPWHCETTTEQLVRALGLPEGTWVHTYQSQFGKDPWLRPATDATVEELAHGGAKRIALICPGFLSDCLETIDENGVENRNAFLEAGGQELVLVPCVNASPAWMDGAATIVREECRGWV